MARVSLCGVALRLLIVVLAIGVFVGTGRAQDSEKLFHEKCASCHGKDGSGHTNASAKMAVPDLHSKRIREMSDADMTDSIANGTKHYAYPHAFVHIGLTNEQIDGLVKYIRTLQKKTPAETTTAK